jgi:hypothetical protein
MSTTMSATTPTTEPIKADHEIRITLQGSDAVPSPIPTMAVGETVVYTSDDGEVRIQFPDRSPFRADNVIGTSVPGAVILTLLSPSGDHTLEGRCFITPKGGEEVGWTPNNRLSGGDHKVTPPAPH